MNTPSVALSVLALAHFATASDQCLSLTSQIPDCAVLGPSHHGLG